MAHFQIPLNLPHAGRLSGRIEIFARYGFPAEGPEHAALVQAMRDLQDLLKPYEESGENPGNEEAARVVAEAARLGRRIVDEVERLKIGHDRLGQAIRNLFETLGLGEEGMRISLRAGENPNSMLRPV